MSYFKELKVKHIDHKFIFVPFSLVSLITVGSYFLLGFQTSLLISISLIFLFLLITIFHVFREIFHEIRYQNIRQQAVTNIHRMIEPRLPLPSLGGWAAFPGLINSILHEVGVSKPSHIVEIGSGSSTIITSYLLEKIGNGTITSLDHDKMYGDITTDQLMNHGLSKFASVVNCELKKQQIKNEDFTWYDLDSVTFNESIDLLVVDGPPEKTQKFARYPALPLLYNHLSEHAVIILDDAARKEEKEIVKRWLKEYPEFTHQYINTEKGISILRR